MLRDGVKDGGLSPYSIARAEVLPNFDVEAAAVCGEAILAQQFLTQGLRSVHSTTRHAGPPLALPAGGGSVVRGQPLATRHSPHAPA
jgi:hypothetical protein